MIQSFIILHLLTCSMIAVCTFHEYDHSWLGSLKMNEDNGAEISNWRKYIASLYFVMTTLSTCGFGDISATSSENYNDWSTIP